MGHRKLEMASYGVGKFLAEFLTGIFGAVVYMFYETEVGLAAGYVAIATIIYALWNAINDPLVGYITEKIRPFKNKFGNRYFWIFAGIILCSLFMLLIFCVPKNLDGKTDSILIFVWMVISVCLYDLMYSVWEVNYQGVFPDKFRTNEHRTNTASISVLIGVFGIVVGFIVPPMLFHYGVRVSYRNLGFFVMAVGVLSIILITPGVRETKEMKERHAKQGDKENPHFFRQMSTALKNRAVLAFCLLVFLYQSGCMCMTSSIHYVVKYILNGGSSTFIFGGMLLGVMVSILFWNQLSKRQVSNQKILLICSFVMGACALPLSVPRSHLEYCILMGLWGFGLGGFWTFMSPASADLVDSLVVENGYRNEGLIMGIRAFFMRLSYCSQAVVFWVIHRVTHFDPDAITPLAVKGISLHMGAFPALFFVLGGIVFLLLNPLNSAQIEKNQKALKEMGI